MLAGIGPADSLSALGIDVAVDLAQVGQNLQNHTTYRIEYGCTKLITGYIYMKPAAGLRELGRYVFARSGYLSGGASPFGGFYRSVDTLPAPDLQMFVSPLLFGRRSGPLGLLPTAHGFSFGINQGIPHSRGAVTLRSADPAVPPSIDPRYFSDPRDLDVLVNGTLRLREIAAQPALARVIDRELAPGPNVATPESILRDVRANAGNHYHVAGTCRMGTDDDAVTDLQLRVRGVAGLRVADLSVAPRLVNGNTNAVATMIAERATPSP
jgi:choline dehydrogenase